MADDLSGEQPALLSTTRAQRADWQLAIPVVLALSAIFAVTIPFAKQPLGYVWAFIPSYQTALAITDLLTASVLLAQFNITRSRALLDWLANCGRRRRQRLQPGRRAPLARACWRAVVRRAPRRYRRQGWRAGRRR